jgi:hypothetical protein
MHDQAKHQSFSDKQQNPVGVTNRVVFKDDFLAPPERVARGLPRVSHSV